MTTFSMARFITALTLCIGLGTTVGACWKEIDPRGYAHECPIIVAGTIEKIAEAAPGGDRADHIASIRILAVHRNELTDVGLKVGDLWPVRMISRNNRVRTSTDLTYRA